MARSNYRKGGISFPFVAVPIAILTGEDWARMTLRARVLMFDLMAQYNGRNNGRLTPALKAMQRRGWSSRDQLWKAKAELLTVPFAIETRKGRPPRTAAWIGFTWWPLDWHESMDIAPTGWRLMNFATLADALIDPNTGRDKAQRRTIPVSRHAGRLDGKTAPIDPRGGPMGVHE